MEDSSKQFISEQMKELKKQTGEKWGAHTESLPFELILVDLFEQ
jgi:hypothetical protein